MPSSSRASLNDSLRGFVVFGVAATRAADLFVEIIAALCRAAAASSLLFLLQVIIVVADAVMDFSVALKRQNVRADAVEKITVVAHNAHHAGKRDQRLLQHAQRRQIQIVRRLVEDEKVAAALQNAREQQPAAFAAGQVFSPAS